MNCRKNSITVSVCITVYNHEAYLRKTIESVLAQKTTFNTEIIIGDDSSYDNSRMIIQEYAKKYSNIIPIIRNKNIGATKNAFDIWEKARGKYINAMDGDDYFIDEYKLQRQVDFLEKHNELSCVAARTIRVNEEGRIIPYKHFSKVELITPHNLNQLKYTLQIGTVLFKNFLKNEDDKNRFSKLLFSHSIIADWSLFLYLLDSSDITCYPDRVLAYRVIKRKDGNNYNSIYRFQKNRYDVILERMKYEQFINDFEFNRVKTNNKVREKAAEMILSLVLDRDKESRANGRRIYREEFVSKMVFFQRVLVPFELLKKGVNYISMAIDRIVCKHESKHEMKTLLENNIE